jgi:membrane-bound ClpP family serine protease
LIVLGALGLIAEVFATTHGTLAAAGTLSFVLGLFWVIDPTQIRLGVSPAVYIPAGIALGGIALTIGWFASRVEKNALEVRESMKGGAIAGLAGYRGQVESAHPGSQPGLESEGTLQIRGETWRFVSEKNVRTGDTVEVVRIEGLTAVVKPHREG